MSASVGSRRAGSKAWGGWAAVAVVLLLSVGCGKTSERKDVAAVPILDTVTGTLTDMRDRKTYRTVVIGQQRWMAENLNYKTDKSVCYENNESNCTKYGRLYTWDDAMTACPAGWHLPSDAEWDSLAVAVGGVRDEIGVWHIAGKKLKSKSGWRDNGNGTDEFGFSALPGGNGWYGVFFNAGYHGHWWSATEDDAVIARGRRMGYDKEGVGWNDVNKYYRFSVRCLEDFAAPQ